MSRIQRFKVGDHVIVADHSPFGTPGSELVVMGVSEVPPIVKPTTGAMPQTAFYWLCYPGQESYRTIPLQQLWDWMLEPAVATEPLTWEVLNAFFEELIRRSPASEIREVCARIDLAKAAEHGIRVGWDPMMNCWVTSGSEMQRARECGAVFTD